MDDAVRAAAEEGMWGAVHHQGDVYDSTLAAIPFLLEVAATSGTGQRTALELLGSFGGIDVSSLFQEPLTLALLEEVSEVLHRHGFPAIRGYALAKLTASLYRLQYL